MLCKNKLIDALAQTHKALVACTECLAEVPGESDEETLKELCILLAHQAKYLNDSLLKQVI